MHFFPLKYEDLVFIPDLARPSFCEDTKGITVTNDDGVPQAICVLDNWSYNSCIGHLWIDNPFVIRHGFGEEICRYVFGDASGREKILGIIPADNERCLRFAKHIGFKELYRIKDGYKKGVDHILTEMNKDTCRYM